ncbi:membrane protein implicated in regulation of membrane protease activity [Rhizobium aethiopicum]|uniref:Membrane protein implicated in regulation of membrane protease activity n=1 Tax=Rhizobium aethiopicum TaxID=1138170 RepID=A0A7W6Q8N3_9HYPH|nr:OB-fold-containig protein [Rhizobium aethiopicum]MBB4190790.1 membrane protein implicated in regulation of membrane protease activity [Rhizobium aethiopicum]MBB4577979.1 membrane protein implicated in regulation of membrane protease activity [Rhizobium aethiopicum]
MALLLAPECTPFAIAAAVLAGLTAIEMLATVMGFSIMEFLGKPDFHGHDGFSGYLSWLNVGGVPLLILIMLALGFFAMTGFAIQAVADAFWAPLPAAIAAIPASLVTVPMVRASSRTVARIVPHDETYAVDLDALIGRTAEVSLGPLDQGLPGRVRVKDQHGNWHVLRAKAARDQEPLNVGTEVLLVDRTADVFIAIPALADPAAADNQSFREQP